MSCGDRVVAASEDGRVYVLDLAGDEQRWSYEVGAPITASPAVARGCIVVGARDGAVYAFGPGRQATEWSRSSSCHAPTPTGEDVDRFARTSRRRRPLCR